MRIGVVVDNEYFNDIRVLNETRFLSESGFQVSVLCLSFENRKLPQKVGKINVEHFTLSKSMKNKLYGLMTICPVYEWIWAQKISDFIKNCKPDVLHVHDLYMSRAAHLAIQNTKLPMILDLHENYPAAVMTYNWAIKFPQKFFIQPWKWKKKEGKYLSFAASLIVLSEHYKESLLAQYQGLQSEKIFVFPNVPNVPELLEFPINKDILNISEEFVIFYFGGISERRGIFTCFEALKILRKEKYPIRLLLIGPVDKIDMRQFSEYLNNVEIKSAITHFPWKDISLLPSYISCSNLCISPILKNPQHESGVANKVFQYMLFSKPILVSNCIPQVKIVDDGQCGLVFESDNPKNLAEKVKLFYNNPELCKKFGENGREAVLNEYNLKNFGKKLIDTYTNIK